jgi:hypothetical protein
LINGIAEAFVKNFKGDNTRLDPVLNAAIPLAAGGKCLAKARSSSQFLL